MVEHWVVLPADAPLVSVNDHIVEPARLWVDRLPAADRERAPHLVADHESERWVIGSEVLTVPALSVLRADGAPGRAQRVADMHPAVFDPAARLAAMDADGVEVHTLLPHVIGFAGERLRFLGDGRLWAACVRAYNDFLLAEFCAAAPDRLAGVALLPLCDPAAAAVELARVATRGARGVSFPHAPAQLGAPPIGDRAWRPLWAAAEETGLPVFVHVGASGGPPSINGVSSPGGLLTLTGLDVVSAVVDLVFSYALTEHPGLQVVLLEGGVGWMPYLADRMEFFGRKRPEVWDPPDRDRSPAQLLADQVAASFIDDAAGLRMLDDIGAHRVLWQSDFPHADSFWPASRAALSAQLGSIADADARAVAGGNALRLLQRQHR